MDCFYLIDDFYFSFIEIDFVFTFLLSFFDYICVLGDNGLDFYFLLIQVICNYCIDPSIYLVCIFKVILNTVFKNLVTFIQRGCIVSQSRDDSTYVLGILMRCYFFQVLAQRGFADFLVERFLGLIWCHGSLVYVIIFIFCCIGALRFLGFLHRLCRCCLCGCSCRCTCFNFLDFKRFSQLVFERVVHFYIFSGCYFFFFHLADGKFISVDGYDFVFINI